MLVGQCPVKSLSSVYPSVCPLLSFLKIGSLVILILYMMIVAMISSDWRSQIFEKKKKKKKKNGSLNWDQMGQNRTQN